jgi:lipopolysaccharide/colanic/teichoic acid biosynthesis glycosyltransferase
MLMKRMFDFIVALVGILILLPLLPLIALMIAADTPGGIIFKQNRVGKNRRIFHLYKFRTMHINAERSGQLTIGHHDSRITTTGYWLRKYKLDELPQLFNVLIGDMSFVGPRPEVEKYVNNYSSEQLHVLDVRPGLTDCSSLDFFNENALLATAQQPEEYYMDKILPMKISQSLTYINQRSFTKDLRVIFMTIKRCLLNR